MTIHPSALVHPAAILASSVQVDAFAIIDENVELADGVHIASHVHVLPGCRLAKGVTVHDGSILGGMPQDRKFQGEASLLIIDENSVIREYVTLNRGTSASGCTKIGKSCLIMAYVHIGHDSHIGDGVTIANSVQIGGHVWIDDQVIVSGMTGIHQKTSIGCGAFIGGGLRVDRDIPPFSKALGEPLAWAGLNQAGLSRLGLTEECRKTLKHWFRNYFYSPNSLRNPGGENDLVEAWNRLAVNRGLSEVLGSNVSRYIQSFVNQSQRPWLRPRI